MSRSAYASIGLFGEGAANAPNNDPLTYCLNTSLDSLFMHGGTGELYGKDSKHCQSFMSEYCANNWDEVCEYASQKTNMVYPRYFPNNLAPCGSSMRRMTQGDILIRNTAAKKYLTMMGNCCKTWEPFDPTVAASPLISYWNAECGYNCVPVYQVDPAKIDSDPVMNKLLANPTIGLDILVNIYNTSKRTGALHKLSHTKLGKFFQSPYFQQFLAKAKPQPVRQHHHH